MEGREQLQLASWAPIGTGLVYVYKNDIYYISAPENIANTQRVTNDGEEGVIYNGIPDWVYEGLYYYFLCRMHTRKVIFLLSNE